VTTYISLLLCICISICSLSAQAYKKVNLQLEDELIDLVSLEDDHVHLITSKGIYDFNILTPAPLALLRDKRIRKTSQNYGHKDKVCFFPLKFGGYIAYNKNHKVVKLESGNLEDGILLQTRNGNKWLANNSLYKNIDGKWKHKDNITSFSSLSDGKTFKDNIWLSSKSEGVFRFDSALKVQQYTTSDGLFSDNCSALHVIDADNAIVGHQGAISIIGPEGIEKVNLKKELGSESILELEMDNAGKLWILTATKLLSLEEGTRKTIEIKLNRKEELVAIHLGSDQNIWALSDKSIYVIPNTEIKKYDVPRGSNHTGSILDFYQIREKNYLSDGQRVYSLTESENHWTVESKKKAPVTVIHDKKGNPSLIFKNNKGIKLSRKNAKQLKKLYIPETEEIINIDIIADRKYYSTKSNLYQVYILDVHENGTLVWLFCSKSIVALDKVKLATGKAEIVKVIPIYQELEKGQMYKLSDDEIWAMGTDQVFRINVNDPITKYTPKMQVYKVRNQEGDELDVDDSEINVKGSDFPISVSYNGTNFWTDNINYAYHLNYDGKNVSEWRNENAYKMNYLGTGKYTLNAKFKDDIYGVNVSAPKVSINVLQYGKNKAGSKKKWLPILAISSLILCCLYFLTRKKSKDKRN